MTIWRMRFACWIPKATDTHSGCVILIAVLCNNGCTNGPQCYAIRTLPVLFLLPVNLMIYLVFIYDFAFYH